MSNNYRASKKSLSIGGRSTFGIAEKVFAFEEGNKLYYISPDCQQKISIRANKADILRTFGELLHKCSCKGGYPYSVHDKKNKPSNKLLIKFKSK